MGGASCKPRGRKGKALLLFLPKSGGSISPPCSDGLEDETVVCGVIPKFPFVGIILSTMFPPTKRSYVCWPPSKFTMLRFETISSGGYVVTVSSFCSVGPKTEVLRP